MLRWLVVAHRHRNCKHTSLATECVPLPLLAEAIGAEMALDTLFLDDGVHGSLLFAFITTQAASQRMYVVLLSPLELPPFSKSISIFEHLAG